MASYKVIDPSIEKLTMLAYITKQLRFYEKQFETYHKDEDEIFAIQFRQHLDNWLLDNLVKI